MFAWTPERATDLGIYIGENKSARVTARLMSLKYEHISHSACISKASRIGLHFHSEPHVRQTRIRKPRQYRQPRIRREDHSIPFVAPMPAKVIRDEDIPLEQRKTLLELTGRSCRWPCGDPQSPSFYFCGAPEADNLMVIPYCPAHSAIAYNRPRKPMELSDAEIARRRRQYVYLLGLKLAVPT